MRSVWLRGILFQAASKGGLEGAQACLQVSLQRRVGLSSCGMEAELISSSRRQHVRPPVGIDDAEHFGEFVGSLRWDADTKVLVRWTHPWRIRVARWRRTGCAVAWDVRGTARHVQFPTLPPFTGKLYKSAPFPLDGWEAFLEWR